MKGDKIFLPTINTCNRVSDSIDEVNNLTERLNKRPLDLGSPLTLDQSTPDEVWESLTPLPFELNKDTYGSRAISIGGHIIITMAKYSNTKPCTYLYNTNEDTYTSLFGGSNVISLIPAGRYYAMIYDNNPSNENPTNVVRGPFYFRYGFVGGDGSHALGALLEITDEVIIDNAHICELIYYDDKVYMIANPKSDSEITYIWESSYIQNENNTIIPNQFAIKQCLKCNLDKIHTAFTIVKDKLYIFSNLNSVCYDFKTNEAKAIAPINLNIDWLNRKYPLHFDIPNTIVKAIPLPYPNENKILIEANDPNLTGGSESDPRSYPYSVLWMYDIENNTNRLVIRGTRLFTAFNVANKLICLGNYDPDCDDHFKITNNVVYTLTENWKCGGVEDVRTISFHNFGYSISCLCNNDIYLFGNMKVQFWENYKPYNSPESYRYRYFREPIFKTCIGSNLVNILRCSDINPIFPSVDVITAGVGNSYYGGCVIQYRNKVFFFGSCDQNGNTKYSNNNYLMASCFDFDTNLWTRLNDIPFSNMSHYITGFLFADTIYLWGSRTVDGNTEYLSLKYNPNTDSYTQYIDERIQNIVDFSRARAVGGFVNDIYLFGNNNYKFNKGIYYYAFDTIPETHRAINNPPFEGLNTGENGELVFPVIPNVWFYKDYCYVFGGQSTKGNNNSYQLFEIYRYSVRNASWVKLPVTKPVDLLTQSYTFQVDNKLFFLGGESNNKVNLSNRVYYFDLDGEFWVETDLFLPNPIFQTGCTQPVIYKDWVYIFQGPNNSISFHKNALTSYKVFLPKGSYVDTDGLIYDTFFCTVEDKEIQYDGVYYISQYSYLNII